MLQAVGVVAFLIDKAGPVLISIEDNNGKTALDLAASRSLDAITFTIKRKLQELEQLEKEVKANSTKVVAK